MENSIIYCVNRSRYFYNWDNAIEYAKEVLKGRMYKEYSNLQPTFTIKETEKGGSIKMNENWEIVGNEKLLYCFIQKIKIF